MNEETISKVLTGETDIAKMSRDDFVELLKCLGRMYLARVMNCVDGTGKSDKEWTALSSIFGRASEAITEKPVGNSAAMREALQKALILLKACDWPDDAPVQDIAKVIDEIEKASSAPPRNCDLPEVAKGQPKLAEQAWRMFKRSHKDMRLDAYGLFCCIRWLLGPATEKEGGAK